MKIENSQKLNWAWDYRCFYLYDDGSIYECTEWYRKNGYIYWIPPLNMGKKKVLRIICKSKVDRDATVRTRKLTLQKQTP
jgi:hypothetical protein